MKPVHSQGLKGSIYRYWIYLTQRNIFHIHFSLTLNHKQSKYLRCINKNGYKMFKGRNFGSEKLGLLRETNWHVTYTCFALFHHLKMLENLGTSRWLQHLQQINKVYWTHIYRVIAVIMSIPSNLRSCFLCVMLLY